MQPVTLEERLSHIAAAKKKLGTKISWIADSMENDLKHAFGDRNNSEFVISPEGKVLVARPWSDPEALRKDLEKFAVKAESLTAVEDLELQGERPDQPAKKIESGVVPRVPRPQGMQPLRIDVLKVQSENPLYVKLRAEAEAGLLKEGGKGKLHIGFHLDPIHHVHWNNLAPPLEFTIMASEGIEVSPSSGSAAKVEEVEADSDPREFLIKVDRSAETNHEPLTLVVNYFACDDGDKWCKAVSHEYSIHWEVDRDAGRVQNRRGMSGRSRGAEEPSRRRPNPEMIFERMDSDKDGSITKSEARGPMVERFDRFDTNEDGAVTLEELKAGFPRS